MYYYRLWYAQEAKTNELLRQWFAKVLDISAADLTTKYFAVRHEPTLQSVEQWENEVEAWKMWASQLAKMKHGVLLEGVAECVHNAGTALDVAGMHEAAGNWWNMSEEIKAHYRL